MASSSDSYPEELWPEFAAEPGLFAEAKRLAEPGRLLSEPARLNGERDCELVPARLKGERDCERVLRLRKLELRLRLRREVATSCGGVRPVEEALWLRLRREVSDSCGASISYSSRCRPASSRNARRLESILVATNQKRNKKWRSRIGTRCDCDQK